MKFNKMRYSKICAAAAITAFLCGCQSAQTAADHRIADALQKDLGPAQQYNVDIQDSAYSLSQGHAKRIVITGENVSLSPTEKVDRILLDIRDISFDPETQRLKRFGTAAFEIDLGQQNLSSDLAAAHREMNGETVTIGEHELIAGVPVGLGALQTTASVRGTLVQNSLQPTNLDFVANSGGLGSLPIPAALVNEGLKFINPVVNLSGLSEPISLSSVQVINKQIVLKGLLETHHLSTK